MEWRDERLSTGATSASGGAGGVRATACEAVLRDAEEPASRSHVADLLCRMIPVSLDHQQLVLGVPDRLVREEVEHRFVP